MKRVFVCGLGSVIPPIVINILQEIDQELGGGNLDVKVISSKNLPGVLLTGSLDYVIASIESKDRFTQVFKEYGSKAKVIPLDTSPAGMKIILDRTKLKQYLVDSMAIQ